MKTVLNKDYSKVNDEFQNELKLRPHNIGNRYRE